MTLDQLLNTDSQHTTIPPREEHVQATIAAARAGFVRAESEMPMATHTFLRIQLALIHKRWCWRWSGGRCHRWPTTFSSPAAWG